MGKRVFAFVPFFIKNSNKEVLKQLREVKPKVLLPLPKQSVLLEVYQE